MAMDLLASGISMFMFSGVLMRLFVPFPPCINTVQYNPGKKGNQSPGHSGCDDVICITIPLAYMYSPSTQLL